MQDRRDSPTHSSAYLPQREIMELAVEFARANDAKKLTETLKEREKELKEQVRALKAKNKPLEDLHE